MSLHPSILVREALALPLDAQHHDALAHADLFGVDLGETDQLHSIFDGAGLSGETGVDNAINNPCMLAAGFAMLDYNAEQ